MFIYCRTGAYPREIMTQVLMEKISHIENLLMEINAKIDNFIGFEEISQSDKMEIMSIREEIASGEELSFDDVFQE